MANRAINSGATTPSGYDSGHATIADAVASSSPGDDNRWTEGFNAGTATITINLFVGVDNQTGSGVADIAHQGTAVYTTSRACAQGGIRVDGAVSVTFEWLQTHSTGTSGSTGFMSTDESDITCKNCFAACENRISNGFQARSQTGLSTGGKVTCHYCVSYHNDSVSTGGNGYQSFHHSGGGDCEVLMFNCAALQATDAALIAASGRTGGSTPAVNVVRAQSSLLYAQQAFQVSIGSDGLDPLDGGAGHNASVNAEGVSLGTDRYENDVLGDWFNGVTIGGGLDWTPKFPSTRTGPDNSANAAKNDVGVAVDFRGVAITTFNIGPFDEGAGGLGADLDSSAILSGDIETHTSDADSRSGDQHLFLLVTVGRTGTIDPDPGEGAEVYMANDPASVGVLTVDGSTKDIGSFGTTLQLTPGESVLLRYDGIKWRVLVFSRVFDQKEYIFDRKAAAVTEGETFFGFEREDDQRWLIKFQAIDQGDGSVVETYANIGNNGAYADLDAAWPNRLTLTYEPFGDLVDP